nr:hypothetical protein [Tanacetum cinerariifolium]
MSRDVLTVGSTMRIPLLYRGKYSQWVERFMNYLEEQMDGEPMINSIKNGDQPLPCVTQVSIAGTTSTEQPPLKDKSMWILFWQMYGCVEMKLREYMFLLVAVERLILIFCPKVEMSRDVLTVGSTMRIPLLYRGEYSQWVERFMNYLEEQTDEEAMINSIKNGDQPLPRATQVYIDGTTSLLIQGLPNDIYSLIDSNKTAKDLWDALARHMLGSEYGEQDKKAAVLYEYETFKATEGELIKEETVVVTFDPLALIAEKTNVSRSKEKVVVSSDSEGSEADDFSELKKITALLAKAFNQRKFYSKPTNNNLRTSSYSQSANKKQEFVKTDNKRVEKKDDEKKRDMSRVKCYNCKK